MDTKMRARLVWSAVGAAVAAGWPGGCTIPPIETHIDADMHGTMELGGQMAMNVGLDKLPPIVMQLRGPTVRYEGTYVSEELFERVHVGQTREDWLVAVVGKADVEANLEDGTVIWRWTYKPVEQEAAVVSLLSTSKDEPRLRPVTTFVRLLRGVVVEKWRG